MEYQLTYAQRRWLKTAGPLKRDCFRARGPVHTEAVTVKRPDGASGKGWLPMLRGLPVDGPVYDAQKDAESRAAREAARLSHLPRLDEEALGIDGAAWSETRACRLMRLRIVGALHLGSLLATAARPDSCPPLRDLVQFLTLGPPTEEPSLAPLLPGDDPRAICLPEAWRERGVFGLALQVRRPVLHEHNGECLSLGFGYYHEGWVYGETWDAAFSAALVWANREQALAEEGA